ncbi:serine/threonine protein phosphatase, putative [Cryptosporidium muris RN66]|uniref:acid phosphatase n=1 Tax=Cryptosporidium muris (strain RN66) TaxID=441375 RepID=B6AF14_CRYMR|nr:serine/threonine protein phosphatase, putative [Cryptosporidium muris RN66]EEA06781.1 serine/threonine protein phosphatase, putative [Cryptosporidium muris RN66]|eukprot:XP_002141130.1 serine/threonine protein phosphatase [Cryptosporidium muris RN66]
MWLDRIKWVILMNVFVILSSKADSLTWITFGDWGEPTGILKSVARSMGEVAEIIDAKFVTSVGDNFYRWGVGSVDDPLWEELFESTFIHEGLSKIPFRCVLGNHDWWGNATAQIDRHYSLESPRWYMPNFWFYTWETFDAPVNAPHPWENKTENEYISNNVVETTALFLYIDTWVMSPPLGSNIKDSFWNDQMKYIEDTLKAAVVRNVDWIFVIGHYPCYSSGVHGDRVDVRTVLEPLLQEYKVDGYIAGHDHHLELSKPKDMFTYHYLVGSACCPKKHDYYNNKHRIFRTGRGGFTSHKLTKNEFHTTYHSIHGDAIFTITQKRLNRLDIRDKLIKKARYAQFNSIEEKLGDQIISDEPKNDTIENNEENSRDKLIILSLEELEDTPLLEKLEDIDITNINEEVGDITTEKMELLDNLEYEYLNNEFTRNISTNSHTDDKLIVIPDDLAIIDLSVSPSVLTSEISDEMKAGISNINQEKCDGYGYILSFYPLPPSSKRVPFKEVSIDKKFYGISFAFGAMLLRNHLKKKISGHPKHEYRPAVHIKHTVGVDGSPVTPMSFFQNIAWREVSNSLKRHFKIPETTWDLMKHKDWKGSFVPWRFVESCTNILRTMSMNKLMMHRRSFIGIPLSYFKIYSKDMGLNTTYKICKDVAKKLHIHKQLQGPSPSNEVMIWDRCPPDSNATDPNASSELKTIIALSVIGTARDYCTLPNYIIHRNSKDISQIGNKFINFLSRFKLWRSTKQKAPITIGGIQLDKLVWIPLPLACKVAEQLIIKENFITSYIGDSIFENTDEIITICAEIVYDIITFLPKEEAFNICRHFTSYELVAP